MVQAVVRHVLRTVLRIRHLRVGILHIRLVMVRLPKQVPKIPVPHQQTVLHIPVHRVNLEHVRMLSILVVQ